MAPKPHKLIGSPLSTKRTIILGILPFVLLATAYFTGSHLRHLDNPMDRLLPNLGQLGAGLVEIVTPDRRTDEVWLWVDTWASLERLAKGMGSGVVIAACLGLSMGVFSTVRAIFGPIITSLAKVPPLAILPIIFILLGVDEISKIVLIALGVIPTLTNDICLAVRAVPRNMVIKGYCLGGSTSEVALKVVLPQSLPRIIDSIRLMIGPAWIFLIAAEAISADSGLGYRIYVVQRQLAMNVILPYVLWIAILGVAMDFGLALLSRRFFPWAHARTH